MTELPKFEDLKSGKEKICVAGLGYVGLPLAVRLASQFKVVGLDINQRRVTELQKYHDHTDEVTPQALEASGIEFTYDPKALADCRIVIVTVPTPVDANKRPDLSPIHAASRGVGATLQAGTVVVYESTVYPGVTEEECVPILEKESGLKWKEDFWVGYSPERINPGDQVHTVDTIVKVVAGDTPETCSLLENLYGSVITAGIHPAESIQVAEAAKVIENTQRDLNIALMNELALIFNRLNINTQAVLEAAGTKWNFLKFFPGLVGGHCIGVDPYYLTHKAESIGYHPQIILAGRRINDGMGKYVAEQTVKHLVRGSKQVKGAKVLVLGFTFKENLSDLRNTKVIDIVHELEDYEVEVSIHDPFASPEEAKEEYGIDLITDMGVDGPYDAIILAVKHNDYAKELTVEKLRELSRDTPIVMDIKWLFDQETMSNEHITYWQL